MKGKKFETTYSIAVNSLWGSLVLCNNIVDVDESVLSNCRFDLFDEEGNEINEIYQWFITSYSESDIEWLEEHFGLLFSYSDMLDMYILCVDHYGTSWNYVYCETDLENFQAEIGSRFDIERKIVKH